LVREKSLKTDVDWPIIITWYSDQLIRVLDLLQLEYQRQDLLRERQQFHMEQLRAAEFRAKQLAAQQISVEQKAGGPAVTEGKWLLIDIII